ncbi:transposase [Pseudoalteromonas sp. P1-26]|uniref:transposase n=1 Tax=Pseudoalteromonas sp. P1-26 TaxID=1723759 RepID=UPI0019108FC5
MEEMLLSVRKWGCSNCGVMDIDRDLNTAPNIRDKGILKLKTAGRSFLHMEAA